MAPLLFGRIPKKVIRTSSAPFLHPSPIDWADCLRVSVTPGSPSALHAAAYLNSLFARIFNDHHRPVISALSLQLREKEPELQGFPPHLACWAFAPPSARLPSGEGELLFGRLG